jgi:hypothetical protein
MLIHSQILKHQSEYYHLVVLIMSTGAKVAELPVTIYIK